MSLIEALPRIERFVVKRAYTYRHQVTVGFSWLLAIMATASVATAVILPVRTEFPSFAVLLPRSYQLNDFEKAGYAAIATVPGNARVCTTNNIAPHFRQRYTVLLERNSNNIPCDYIVMAAGVLDFNMTPEVKTAIAQTCAAATCKTVFDNNGWRVQQVRRG